MNYKVFTRHLRSLEDNRRTMADLAFELDSIVYDMGGVKGLRYDLQAVHGNPSVKEEKRLEMVERYNEKLKEYEFIRDQISFIESTLNKMPEELKTMLDEVYIQGMTFSYVGKLHGYSDHGLWKMMKRETEKYL